MSATESRRARTDLSAANERPRQRQPAWPGDPAHLAPEDIDFEAIAHVLANTCRWGGRSRQFHSLAAHAVIASEEIEALDGLGAEDRRVLALHALLSHAQAAWIGDAAAGGPASARAAERAKREGAAIDRAMLEATGLDPEVPEEQAELLRFVRRMTDAAERRDLPDAAAAAAAGAGMAFPPCKRRIRPVGPARAARLWLDRFHALGGPPQGTGAAAAKQTESMNEEEMKDVTHIPSKTGKETQRARPELPKRGGERDAA